MPSHATFRAMNKPVTLSIITPSYNQAAFLEETLRSVISQRDQVHEYFVYDGGSTDGSRELIEKYAAHIDHWVSEKDAGQPDVLARGFARATGDYLAWVNSDDVYRPGALARVREALAAHPEWDVVTGWHVRMDAKSRLLSAHRLAAESAGAARWGSFHPCQPTVFFRRALYEKVGGVNPDLHLVMDTEMFFRMMDAGAVFGHVPAYIAGFRRHGESKGVGTYRKYASEYEFLDRRYPHYHAKSFKHYLGRAVTKGLRMFSGRESASRRDTRDWRGKTIEEVFGAWITNPDKPADNVNSAGPGVAG
jgi:glycosyltransferase involved in cell wall biosynthesis